MNGINQLLDDNGSQMYNSFVLFKTSCIVLWQRRYLTTTQDHLKVWCLMSLLLLLLTLTEKSFIHIILTSIVFLNEFVCGFTSYQLTWVHERLTDDFLTHFNDFFFVDIKCSLEMPSFKIILQLCFNLYLLLRPIPSNFGLNLLKNQHKWCELYL